VYGLENDESIRIETYSIIEILSFHMENLLTSISLRNFGLRTLLLEVEIHLVRRGSLSFIEILPA